MDRHRKQHTASRRCSGKVRPDVLIGALIGAAVAIDDEQAAMLEAFDSLIRARSSARCMLRLKPDAIICSAPMSWPSRRTSWIRSDMRYAATYVP